MQLAVGHGKSGYSCGVEGFGALDEDAAEVVALPDGAAIVEPWREDGYGLELAPLLGSEAEKLLDR